MSGLDVRQSRLLLDIIERIYAAQTFQEFTATLLKSIARLIPAGGVTYNEMDTRRRRSIDLFEPVPPRLAEVMPSWREHMHEQPVVAYFLKHRDRRPRAISDFLSQRQMHDLGMYSEVFRWLKTEDALCIALEVHGNVFIGVGVGRDRRGFSDRKRLALDLLRPHIAQAWRNVRTLTEMRERMEAMGATLAAQGLGVIDLDGKGHSRDLSAETRALLSRYFGGPARLTGGRIPEALRTWVRQVRQLGPETGLVPPRAPLILDSEHGRLIIHLQGSSNGNKLLLREEPHTVSATSLRSLGLTPRECEVLAWIAEGKTNAEIAVILGMSHHTVKRHVEDILCKLGAETRTGAANIALHATMNGNP